MLRRIYVMPLDAHASAARVSELVRVLDDADRHIAGLVDSCAAVDLYSRTVVWEMVFRDEQTYAGSYMVHPYHVATLDAALLADSPERISHDFDATLYRVQHAPRRVREGVRRIVLMKMPDGADDSVLRRLADRAGDMTLSTLARTDPELRSSIGLKWTHVWEQTFADVDAMERHLRTAQGLASSTRQGFRQQGVEVQQLRIVAYPFRLKEAQSPPFAVAESGPLLYSMTARVSSLDASTFVELLEQEYDPSLARFGVNLSHRWRTLDHAGSEVEVQSTWQVESIAAFTDFRATTAVGADPSWNRFVVNAMPLVRGGTRRFYRPLRSVPTGPDGG